MQQILHRVRCTILAGRDRRFVRIKRERFFACCIFFIAGVEAFDLTTGEFTVNPLVGSAPLKFCIAGVGFDATDNVHELVDVNAVGQSFYLLCSVAGCHVISP